MELRAPDAPATSTAIEGMVEAGNASMVDANTLPSMRLRWERKRALNLCHALRTAHVHMDIVTMVIAGWERERAEKLWITLVDAKGAASVNMDIALMVDANKALNT